MKINVHQNRRNESLFIVSKHCLYGQGTLIQKTLEIHIIICKKKVHITMSEFNFFSYFKFACFLVCFSVVFYLTIQEILRYTNNEDTSSIAFTKFNSSPKDKYPVITFCFYGKYESIYKKEEIENAGLTISEYWNLILCQFDTEYCHESFCDSLHSGILSGYDKS